MNQFVEFLNGGRGGRARARRPRHPLPWRQGAHRLTRLCVPPPPSQWRPPSPSPSLLTLTTLTSPTLTSPPPSPSLPPGAWLLSPECADADDALAIFALERTDGPQPQKPQGVDTPSQRRYVHQLASMLHAQRAQLHAQGTRHPAEQQPPIRIRRAASVKSNASACWRDPRVPIEHRLPSPSHHPPITLHDPPVTLPSPSITSMAFHLAPWPSTTLPGATSSRVPIVTLERAPGFSPFGAAHLRGDTRRERRSPRAVLRHQLVR